MKVAASLLSSHFVLSCLAVLAACNGAGGGEAEDGREETGTDPTAEDSAAEPGGEDVVETGEDSAGEVELACNPGSSWGPGTPVFREVTEEWGLAGVRGVVMGVTDIDGDGWPDLLVRSSDAEDDFSGGGTRCKWVLHNTGAGSFEDVTRASGALRGRVNTDPDFGRPGATWSSGDVDNDGDLDLFTGATRVDLDPDKETSEVMLNDGDGTFSLGPEGSAARFAGQASSPMGGTFTDFDRDGFLDLWVVHHERPVNGPMQDRLLKGDGTGGFADVTYARGLFTSEWTSIDALNNAEAHSWGWASAACDLSGDGIPELLASSYGRAPNHLWRGTDEGGTIAYENASISSGYAYDDNLDWGSDLNAQCYCMDNPAEPGCDAAPPPEDPSICPMLYAGFGGMYRWDNRYGREPFELGGNSGTTICADIDNDGDLDLVTCEIVHWDVGPASDPSEILVNTGAAGVIFERPGSDVTGLVRVDDSWDWNHGDMTGAVFDFDNDGWLDVYIGASDYPGNHALLFRQTAPLRFILLKAADYFLHYRAQGNAVADFDRDGDLDILVGHSLMRCEYAPSECQADSQVHLFENITGEGSNWIQLHLEGGAGTNRAAIGARVQVTAGGVTQTQEVDGGHGQGGLQRDLVLHFGLGPSCEAEVSIRWPDAALTTQTLSLHANARYRVVQGEDAVIE
jgi:hypothetical protein